MCWLSGSLTDKLQYGVDCFTERDKIIFAWILEIKYLAMHMQNLAGDIPIFTVRKHD